MKPEEAALLKEAEKWLATRTPFADFPVGTADKKQELVDRLAQSLRSALAREAELRDAWHYAYGVADLAMKHRDMAEQRNTESAAEIERLTKEYHELQAGAVWMNGEAIRQSVRAEAAERERDTLKKEKT